MKPKIREKTVEEIQKKTIKVKKRDYECPICGESWCYSVDELNEDKNLVEEIENHINIPIDGRIATPGAILYNSKLPYHQLTYTDRDYTNPIIKPAMRFYVFGNPAGIDYHHRRLSNVFEFVYAGTKDDPSADFYLKTIAHYVLAFENILSKYGKYPRMPLKMFELSVGKKLLKYYNWLRQQNKKTFHDVPQAEGRQHWLYFMRSLHSGTKTVGYNLHGIEDLLKEILPEEKILLEVNSKKGPTKKWLRSYAKEHRKKYEIFTEQLTQRENNETIDEIILKNSGK